MAVFRLTKLALADLRSIGRYTQTTWGREQRNRYLAKLDARREAVLKSGAEISQLRKQWILWKAAKTESF